LFIINHSLKKWFYFIESHTEICSQSKKNILFLTSTSDEDDMSILQFSAERERIIETDFFYA